MRARKKDANHDAIKAEYERLGCITHDTNGDWDLTMQKHTLTDLAEIKNRETAYGRKGLSKRQKAIAVRRWVVYDLRDVAQHVSHLDAIAEAIRRAA